MPSFSATSNTDSKIDQLKEHPLDYAMLGELNTRPRTTYLAKVQNTRTQRTFGTNAAEPLRLWKPSKAQNRTLPDAGKPYPVTVARLSRGDDWARGNL